MGRHKSSRTSRQARVGSVRQTLFGRDIQRETAARSGRAAKTATPAVPEVHLRRSVRRRGVDVPGNAQSGPTQGPGVPRATGARRLFAGRRRPAAGTVRHERPVPELGPQPVRHGNRPGVRAFRPGHVQNGFRTHPGRGRHQNVRDARPKVRVPAVARVGRRLFVARRRHGKSRAAAGRELGAHGLCGRRRRVPAVRSRRQGVRRGEAQGRGQRRNLAAGLSGRSSGRRFRQRRYDKDN